MPVNKIKFQVFLNNDEAVKIKMFADRLSGSGLSGSISEAIRIMVKRGLIYSKIDELTEG